MDSVFVSVGLKLSKNYQSGGIDFGWTHEFDPKVQSVDEAAQEVYDKVESLVNAKVGELQAALEQLS